MNSSKSWYDSNVCALTIYRNKSRQFFCPRLYADYRTSVLDKSLRRQFEILFSSYIHQYSSSFLHLLSLFKSTRRRRDEISIATTIVITEVVSKERPRYQRAFFGFSRTLAPRFLLFRNRTISIPWESERKERKRRKVREERGKRRRKREKEKQ